MHCITVSGSCTCTHIIWVWFLDHLVLYVSSGVCVVFVDTILVRERKDMHAAVFNGILYYDSLCMQTSTVY